MTTLDLTSIPSEIDTVEKLVIWGCCVLQELYSTMKVTEDVSRAPELVVQMSGHDLAVPIDNDWTYVLKNRAIGRISIPLANTWKRQALYLSAEPLGNEVIPVEYLNVE
jgi:hypothetical protein